jgi:uncharacterized protein CbrC (UPF0167 family)
VPDPRFRYHPDPIATGSAERSDAVCSLCHRARGTRYRGPVYGRRPEVLCLHCIYSGDASLLLGTDGMPAQFTDTWGAPGDVPQAVVEVLTRRTPGFTGWQQERWLYHCADATAFLGPVGRAELNAYPEALAMLDNDCRNLGWSREDTDKLLSHLDRATGPTAYLFRCLHCGAHLAYWDSG